MGNNDNANNKNSAKENENKAMQETENEKGAQKLRHQLLSISITLIVLGLLWFGINLWKIFLENDIDLGGKKRLSDTFYWGENYEIEVQWKWFRSDVKNKEEIIITEENKILNQIKETHKEIDKTLCFISGTINNKSDKTLQVYSITMFLQTGDEINLYEIYKSLDLSIEPKEQEQFEISEYIDSSLLPHFKKMGAGLAFNFVEKE